MENGAFAPKEQTLHFPKYFQIRCISKASKGKGLRHNINLKTMKTNLEVKVVLDIEYQVYLLGIEWQV